MSIIRFICFFLHRLLILTVALAILGPVVAAELDTRLSRSPITINQSFQLIIESSAAPDGEPDFSPLQQAFELINRSQSQNIQMINGNFSRTTTWTVTLMARQTGRLTIPAIRFGADSSRPLVLEVLPADPARDGLTGDDIFIRVESDLDHAYQGQQILLTLQLYRAVSTDNATLSPPTTSDPDIAVRKLGDDRQYESRLENREYLVTERRYALFPRSSGTLTIDPFVFQGEIVRPSAGGRLFGSPFGGFRQPGQTRRIQSQPLRIDIRPRPADWPPRDPWLPSSNLQLVENWGSSAPAFKVGEPITRTLMLFADGLTSAQLPELTVELPEGLKQYPDQPLLRDRENREGITGIREMKIAVVPSRAGVFTLPGISVRWWNTAQERIETATLPAQTIQVSADAEPPPEPTPPPASSPVEEVSRIAAQDGAPMERTRSYLPWLALFLGSGWLITLLIWWGLAHRRAPDAATERGEPAGSRPPDSRAVRRACLADEPAHASAALLAWAGQRWPDSPPRTLAALAGRIGSSGFSDEIAALEEVLYAPTKSGWQGAGLWQQLERSLEAQKTPDREPDPIAPLHPT